MRHLLNALYAIALSASICAPAWSMECVMLNSPPPTADAGLDSGSLDVAQALDASSLDASSLDSSVLDSSVLYPDNWSPSVPALPPNPLKSFTAAADCPALGTGVDITTLNDNGSDGANFSQAGATAKPTCFQDSDSNWYLHFDGNDWMATSGAPTHSTGTVTFCFVYGFEAAGSAIGSKYWIGGGSASTRGMSFVTDTSLGGSPTTAYQRLYTGSGFVTTNPAVVTDNVRHVTCGVRDITGATNSTIYHDDQTGTSGLTGNHNIVDLTLGSYYARTSLFPTGRFYAAYLWSGDQEADAMARLRADFPSAW